MPDLGRLTPGAGRKRKSPLDLSFNEFLVLNILMARPSHGWAIWTKIRNEEELRMSTSTLYEAIGRLFNDGLLDLDREDESAAPGSRKVMRITGTGEEAVSRYRHLHETVQRLSAVVRPGRAAV